MALVDQTYARLAKDIQGRVLHLGNNWYTIVEAQGFSRKQNDAGLYRPLLEMAPGTVYFARHRNALLFLIACKDGQGTGGCVLIREILDQESAVHSGPGAVSAALGVEDHGATGTITERADGDLVLTVLHSEPKKNGRKPKADSDKKPGISPRALGRLMPAITRHFMAHGQGKKFQEHLQELLGQHHDEGSLLRAVSE